MKLSAIVAIGLPTLIAALYYGLFAADQFSAEARFAIRGANAKSGPDLLGLFGGSSGSGSVAGDSYIVMDYIRSREILEKMTPAADIRGVCSNPRADWVARLDQTVSIEELVKCWRTMAELGFDASSQIVTIKVRAFTPAEAKLVLEAILRFSEEFITRCLIGRAPMPCATPSRRSDAPKIGSRRRAPPCVPSATSRRTSTR